MIKSQEQHDSTQWRKLAVLYTSVFVDITAVSIIIPLITPFLRSLSFTATQIGLLSSTYGIIQLFSAPLLGRWSDGFPRGAAMAICSVGGATTLDRAQMV